MTMTPPLADVPIRSADALTDRWTMLLDPPVFGARSLWLSWLGADGRMLPVVIPVEDLLGLEEAPNLPGTTDQHPNWRRRLPGVVDSLLDTPATKTRFGSTG